MVYWTPRRREFFKRQTQESRRRHRSAVKSLRAGLSIAQAAKASGLSEQTIKKNHPIRNLVPTVSGEFFRDRSTGITWCRVSYLAQLYGVTVNAVDYRIRSHKIPTKVLLTSSGYYRTFVDKKAYDTGHRHSQYSLLARSVVPRVQTVAERIRIKWGQSRFPELTELEWVIYVTIGVWKKKLYGHNPTLGQITQAIGLGPTHIPVVGKAAKELERKGHVKRMPLRDHRGAFLWVLTTDAERVPDLIAYNRYPCGKHAVPWYLPNGKNGNGTTH